MARKQNFNNLTEKKNFFSGLLLNLKKKEREALIIIVAIFFASFFGRSYDSFLKLVSPLSILESFIFWGVLTLISAIALIWIIFNYD